MPEPTVLPEDATRVDPPRASHTGPATLHTQRQVPGAGPLLQPDARVLGRWVVRRFIGAGGCGEVYEVLDERTRRVVALKLNNHANADPWAVGALRGEFATLATLRHPSLAEVYDFGFFEEAAFFTQELVRGAPIDEMGLTLESPIAIDLVLQLCRALAYLHARGILHRDIKPPNILVDVERQRLVLLDFGIAQSFGAAGTETVFGTPTYVSPEAIRGQPLDARSDLYSLGVLLYRLASGAVPFSGRGRTVDDVFWDQLVTAPKALPSSTPPALAAVVMRLLEKEPAHRHASAGEVIDAIAAAAGRDVSRETPETLASYVLSASYVDPGRVLASAENACRAESPVAALALVGEAGAGKSRLLRELRHRLQVRGVSWVPVQVRRGAPADALLHDVAVGTLTDDAVRGLDAPDRIELVRIVPSLRARGERIVIPSDVERSRELGIAALARAIGSVFGARQGVVAIDDVHRAGESSVRQLCRLVVALRAGGARCTIVASGRPGLAMSAFVRDAAALEIGTAPLDAAGCTELVRATLGDADVLRGTELARAFESAPRAALWVQESIRLAIEQKQIVRRRARFERALEVPALDAEELLTARVRGLAPAASTVALACAVWAMPATASELARVAGASLVRGAAALRELVRAGIAEEERDARGRVTYAIHDRFADVVPTLFSTGHVQRAHARAARAHLRRERSADARAHAAGHLLLAGDAAAARAVYLEAAREAERAGHPSAALGWVNQALAAAPDAVSLSDHLLRHDVATTCGAKQAAAESLAWLRAHEAEASVGGRVEVRLRVATRSVASGDAESGRAAAREALALSEETGDALAQARAHRALAEADWLFGSIEASLASYARAATLATERGAREDAARAFVGASLAELHLGRTRAALLPAQRGVQAAKAEGDLALRSDAQRQLGNVTRELGQTARARTYYRLAVQSARAAGCLEREGKALNNLGTVEHWLGGVSAGLASFEQSIALKERAGATASALLGYNNLAALQNALGLWDAARITLARIMTSPSADLALARPIALSNVGDLEIAEGHLDEAIDAYAEGVALCRERRLVTGQTHGLANWSRALAMRSRPHDRTLAADALRELEDLASRHEIAEVRRRVHAVRSVLASVAGRHDDAVREARVAVRVRDRHTRFSDLFHTPIETRWILALALGRRGRSAEAIVQAERARRELTEMSEMVAEPSLRASYLERHPLHAAILVGSLDLPAGWTWRAPAAQVGLASGDGG
jgi:tetratricopeptide (TPR) repeat protein